MTTCGGNVTSLGIDYPSKGNYPDGKDCRWKVIRNAPFSIQFVRIDIEYRRFCDVDFVEIGGRRFCGKTIPRKNFNSTGNHLNIRFHSDADSNRRGFKIRVEPRLYEG